MPLTPRDGYFTTACAEGSLLEQGETVFSQAHEDGRRRSRSVNPTDRLARRQSAVCASQTARTAHYRDHRCRFYTPGF